MNKRIITISRQFGSGGRSIGKAVADKLGINYYDKELIEKVANITGFAKDFIEEQGEHSPSKYKFAYSFVGRGINGMSVEDYLWKVQRDLILEIAQKEECVIVGRCADYILNDRKDCLNVFIYAPDDYRIQRIVKLYGETSKTPKKRLNEKDKKRSINYEYYTDRVWGDATNYDISLNSSTIGIENCVDIITNLAK